MSFNHPTFSQKVVFSSAFQRLWCGAQELKRSLKCLASGSPPQAQQFHLVDLLVTLFEQNCCWLASLSLQTASYCQSLWLGSQEDPACLPHPVSCVIRIFLWYFSSQRVRTLCFSLCSLQTSSCSSFLIAHSFSYKIYFHLSVILLCLSRGSVIKITLILSVRCSFLFSFFVLIHLHQPSSITELEDSLTKLRNSGLPKRYTSYSIASKSRLHPNLSFQRYFWSLIPQKSNY
jgi:hypothetical protein